MQGRRLSEAPRDTTLGANYVQADITNDDDGDVENDSDHDSDHDHSGDDIVGSDDQGVDIVVTKSESDLSDSGIVLP